ncbi:sodium:solute symporter family protein [Curtobacterium ammoniigenes]|uniref:sodium:solute symporter family protein n=1 Tax=Curtobacterium ammoniigenes TaxID=395387 RepID=UPI00082B6F49|nr:sodium:solute symporter family protein [Curtobacterium ammoniigenes]
MVSAAAANPIQLSLSWVDYLMIIVYFAVVIGIGFTARRQVRTSMDFFLSGRSMPAWITGLAFVSANLGATEILGMAANGAQIGMATLHYYLIGAVPAMVFLGLVMMPFYYGSKVRSVPEFMLRRFGKAPHLVNAIAFAVSNVLIAGINLYAMAIVIEAMLGWPEWLAIIVSAGFVLVYITLGGLSSAIYNEVMQFFVIIAGLIPLTIVGLHRVGGWNGLSSAIAHTQGVEHLSTWAGTAIGHTTNPIGANWLAIVLGLGFVLSFGYWTTNFTEVQRAFSAKNMSAARRTPLIAAIPKLFIPFIVVIPGLIAAAVIGNQFADPHSGLTYNDAIPKLIQMYLPTGVLGVAVTGLLASFMAGMAANVSSFNTVFTYDIWQRYIKPNMPDVHYLRTGRWVTIAGVLIGIATAFIAAQAQNIMTYMQTLFSFFNAPLFAVFILGLLWKRMTTSAALWSYILGIVTPTITWIAYLVNPKLFATATAETLYGAIISFVTVLVVGVVISLFTKPKAERELSGLVYGIGKIDLHGDAVATDTAWYRSPALLGTVALVLCVVLYLPFL